MLTIRKQSLDTFSKNFFLFHSNQPETAADKCTKNDVYFCCPSMFGHPKPQMNGASIADVAFSQSSIAPSRMLCEFNSQKDII